MLGGSPKLQDGEELIVIDTPYCSHDAHLHNTTHKPLNVLTQTLTHEHVQGLLNRKGEKKVV